MEHVVRKPPSAESTVGQLTFGEAHDDVIRTDLAEQPEWAAVDLVWDLVLDGFFQVMHTTSR
jgi:hypothetical protein